MIHGLDYTFPLGPRFVGDPLCWTLPLDTTGLDHLPGIQIPNTDIVLSHDPVCTVSWALEARRETRPVVEIYSRATSRNIFYLDYIFAFNNFLEEGVLEFIGSRRRSQQAMLNPGDVWVPKLCVLLMLFKMCYV